MISSLAVDIFTEKSCSSGTKVKTGLQVIRHVECFKNALHLTSCNGPMSMTTRPVLHNIIWLLPAEAVCYYCLRSECHFLPFLSCADDDRSIALLEWKDLMKHKK